MSSFVDIVFTGPPGPEPGAFVEVEDANGKSIRFGDWVKRDDGFWALRIPQPAPQTVILPVSKDMPEDVLLTEIADAAAAWEEGNQEDGPLRDALLALVKEAAPWIEGPTFAETMLEQLVLDLNQAHDEICKMQNLDPATCDWPEWTPQANSIRAVEKYLGKRLAKTTKWTLFPDQEL